MSGTLERCSRSILCLAAGLIAVVSCTNATADGLGPGGVREMAARVSGAQWTASEFDVTRTGNRLRIEASNAGGVQIVLELFDLPISEGGISAPLTVELTPEGAPVVGYAALVLPLQGTWATDQPEATGTVTFTTLSTSRAAGTFSFVGYPVAGGTVSRSVTNGSFDVAIQ